MTRTFFITTMATLTCSLVTASAAVAQENPKLKLRGTWDVVDQRTKERIASIRLTPDQGTAPGGAVEGRYESMSRWPRAYNEGRGPSGTRFVFVDRELKIIYPHSGTNRTDELLILRYVDAIDDDQYVFRVTGGAQIAEGAKGVRLILRR